MKWWMSSWLQTNTKTRKKQLLYPHKNDSLRIPENYSKLKSFVAATNSTEDNPF